MGVYTSKKRQEHRAPSLTSSAPASPDSPASPTWNVAGEHGDSRLGASGVRPIKDQPPSSVSSYTEDELASPSLSGDDGNGQKKKATGEGENSNDGIPSLLTGAGDDPEAIRKSQELHWQKHINHGCPLNAVWWTHTCIDGAYTAKFADQLVCSSPICQAASRPRTAAEIKDGLLALVTSDTASNIMKPN